MAYQLDNEQTKQTAPNNSLYAIVALGIDLNRISLTSFSSRVLLITMNTTTG
jgi:hypothetical protein